MESALRYLPIELDVRGREAVVVGDHGEAEPKVRRLLAAGARVRWFAAAPDAARLASLRAVTASAPGHEPLPSELQVFPEAPTDADIAAAFVVFIDGDDALAARVHTRALAEGRLVCALDRPEHSTFANPAVAHAHGVTISAGSGGISPGTVREIRRALEAAIATEDFARWMAKLAALRASFPRGERSEQMRAATQGFRVAVSVRFPAWFEGADAGSSLGARYEHTNLIAHDWRKLVDFYVRVFDCKPLDPERDLSGPWLDEGTGVRGAHIRGRHLRVPGHGDHGPTLEIFGYDEVLPQGPPAANRAGFTHLAFSVRDVAAAVRAVVAAGGSAHGAVVSREVPGVGVLTFTYAADPEGNLIELQQWAPLTTDASE